MTERDILHENGGYWVTKHNGLFIVMKNGATHSVMVDGVGYADKSLAIARCDYLAKRSLTRQA